MRSRAKRLHTDLVAKYGSMIAGIGQRLESGEAVPDCLAKTMLQSREEEGLDWTDMCMLASAFMIGGVETVRALADMAGHSLD